MSLRKSLEVICVSLEPSLPQNEYSCDACLRANAFGIGPSLLLLKSNNSWFNSLKAARILFGSRLGFSITLYTAQAVTNRLLVFKALRDKSIYHSIVNEIFDNMFRIREATKFRNKVIHKRRRNIVPYELDLLRLPSTLFIIIKVVMLFADGHWVI